jgi:hypothetical protein
MKFRKIAPLVVGAGMMAVASLGFLPAASADPTTTTAPLSLAPLQAKLEAQLTARQTQLATLTTDVSSSTTLTSSDAATLSASLATETSNINTLLAGVPTDTLAELQAARQAMFQDNRVFVVMSPQVRLTIAADTINSNAGTILTNGPTVSAALTAREADQGYARAEERFAFSTAKATVAQSTMTSVSGNVLAQTPAGWPANERVFVQARIEILRARFDLALARADLRLVESWINRNPS